MSDAFEPRECPVGQLNELKLEHTEDRLTQMIERLEEKINETQADIASLSRNMDQKFDGVDKRFDDMNDKIEKLKVSIPSTVNDELKNKAGNSAVAIIKWIFGGVCGTIIITVLASWVKLKLGL